LIRTTLEEQLRFDPDKETRNRKPLQRPVALEATWELRLGPENRFRVFSRGDVEGTGKRREDHPACWPTQENSLNKPAPVMVH
jgi:hypothetical protein